MRLFVLFTFLVILPTFLSGQILDNSYLSKHGWDKKNHNPNNYRITKSNDIEVDKTYQPTTLSRNLSHSVFGYLPYWEYPDALPYLQYELLSHISVFDFEVNIDGSLYYPVNWPWTELLVSAQENDVKVILTAVNFNGSQIHTLLTNESVKSNLFSNLLLVLQQYSMDGVNIDFENVNYSDRGSILVDFMTELTSYLHNANSSYEVSFASPPVNWGGWDFHGLANSCDYLFIMGYNFYGPWSNTSGPCAPLIGGTYNISSVILDEYWSVVDENPQKLILGVPYYGNMWKTNTQQAYSNVIDHISQPTYQIAMNNAELDTLVWDHTSNTSWSYYESNNSYYQTWFDNDSSIGLKYSLAVNYQLKGAGMWALGYDGYRTELWDEIRKHFWETVTVEEFNDDKTSLIIYPNPSVGKFTLDLNHEIEKGYSVQLFNSFGQKVVGSIKTRIVGYSKLSIEIDNYTPGIYLCVYRNLQSNNQQFQIQRIILQ